jgi:hypothetical protein
MFVTLLVVIFLVAVAISTLVAFLFTGPIRRIMTRIVPDQINDAWVRYMIFAIYVVGIAGGVGLRRLERYITPDADTGQLLQLTGERWMVEIYSAVIGSLAAMTWMLLVFFVFALIAYVVVRAFELKRGDSPAGGESAG